MENGVFCDELVTSLTSFLCLYSRHGARLQAISESFTLTVAQLEEVSASTLGRALFAFLGGGLGALCGGLSGGVCGALGTIAVGICTIGDNDINAVGATMCFFGGMLGGVAGGVLGGAVGGAVGSAGTGRSLWGLVRDLSSLTIGFATGEAVGGILGGSAGAAGGAIGGAFGAICASAAVTFVGGVFRIGKSKEQKTNLMETAGNFSEVVSPLVEELNTIKTISDKMASSVFVHGVARQSAVTLASVSAMEQMMGAYRTTGLLWFVQEAATQCRKITEELETTRAEVEKCLTSVENQKLDKPE